MLEFLALLIRWRGLLLLIYVQEPATLLEYSMIAVTEGIDAIATTRVVIRGDTDQTSTHALTGESVQRTFRYGEF